MPREGRKEMEMAVETRLCFEEVIALGWRNHKVIPVLNIQEGGG